MILKCTARIRIVQMPRKKVSAPSKGATKVEEKKVREWTEDEEKKLKKYYTL